MSVFNAVEDVVVCKCCKILVCCKYTREVLRALHRYAASIQMKVFKGKIT
jgi:hypothetical protein